MPFSPLVKVRVSGFQSLRGVVIDLGSITTIVGPSDSGKSAFIRALRALSENRRGLEFLSKGATTCEVFVEDRDQNSVTWSKASGEGFYKLRVNGSDLSFTKIRSTVPEEIQKVLGLVPVSVEREDLSLQFSTQYDAPFMVDESGSIISSRFLGHFAGFNIFSKSGQISSSDRNQVSKTLNVLESELEKTRVAPQSMVLLDQVRVYAEQISSRTRLLDMSLASVSEMERLQRSHKETAALLSEEQRILSTGESVAQMAVSSEALTRLFSSLGSMEALRQASETAVGILQSADKVTSVSALVLGLDKTLDLLDTNSRKLDDMLALDKAKLTLVYSIRTIKTQKDQLVAEESALLAELASLQTEVQAFCPFFDQSIPEGRECECSVAKSRV